MEKTFQSVCRWLQAAVSAFAAFSVLWCFSHLPDVARGPWGYGKAAPSHVAALLLNVAPTGWFCFGFAPLVFWMVYLQKCRDQGAPLRLVFMTIQLFVGAAAWFLSDLVVLHGTYAMEPPPPAKGRVAINVMLLTLMLVSCAVKVTARVRTTKAPLRDRQSMGSRSADERREGTRQ